MLIMFMKFTQIFKMIQMEIIVFFLLFYSLNSMILLITGVKMNFDLILMIKLIWLQKEFRNYDLKHTI